ncbi:MAG: ribosome assembly RNA-binding protein YhbY [Polyangiaceae bacterium]
MSALVLDGKQRRHLRGLAHDLDPLVQIGKNGLTDGVIGAIDEVLEQHELVKVRVGTECPEDRATLAERVPPATNSSLVGEVGRIMILYRRHPQKPVIDLPGLPPTGRKRPAPKKKAAKDEEAAPPPPAQQASTGEERRPRRPGPPPERGRRFGTGAASQTRRRPASRSR